VTETARGRGWLGVLGLTLAVATLSVVNPALLLFTPLALLLLAVPPHRPWLVGLAVMLTVVVLTGPARDPLWFVERGWALVVGAWFVVAVVAWPRARFFARAAAAVAASLGTVALVLAARRGGFTTVEWWLGERLRSGATDAASLWARGVGAERVSEPFAAAATRMAELQLMLYPSLLALASLAALAVAWWAHRRLTAHEAWPLGRLREFRFHDAFVWLLIAGLVLMLLPLDAVGTRIGSNVLLFMAALYVLRGLAVLTAMAGTPSAAALVVGGLATLLLYPLVLTFAAIVGLSDTWLDIRARRDAAAGRGT
jgi:hypothetical protein